MTPEPDPINSLYLHNNQEISEYLGNMWESMKPETIVKQLINYLKTGSRYTAPSQIYDTFSFLMHETKEMFITIHLDGKNRIVCCDLVSIGSLNQSIVKKNRKNTRFSITQ
jgi:DNA repair protein RadC